MCSFVDFQIYIWELNFIIYWKCYYCEAQILRLYILWHMMRDLRIEFIWKNNVQIDFTRAEIILIRVWQNDPSILRLSSLLFTECLLFVNRKLVLNILYFTAVLRIYHSDSKTLWQNAMLSAQHNNLGKAWLNLFCDCYESKMKFMRNIINILILNVWKY